MPINPLKANGHVKPFWTVLDGLVTLYQGDSLKVLRSLPPQSVHCVVTSPPYWKQREYAGAGAEQLGQEKYPRDYVVKLFSIFEEVGRVLRDDGTLWLNLGDKYVNGELCGLPWQVAFILQSGSWKLRQDIIWHKPSTMPSPVDDRCTTAHEYIFLLAKSNRYYYDATAIREPGVEPSRQRADRIDDKNGHTVRHSPGAIVGASVDKNKRSVWTVVSEGFDGAHFACFPPKLIEPCILAGCPEKVCSDCGAPFTRIVEKEQLTRERPNDYVKRNGSKGTGNACANSVAGVAVRTTGWGPGCECGAETLGGIVLDPFVGSGTTPCVAIATGRRSVGIDLSGDYLRDIAIPRVEGAMLERPTLGASVGSRVALTTGAARIR